MMAGLVADGMLMAIGVAALRSAMSRLSRIGRLWE